MGMNFKKKISKWAKDSGRALSEANMNRALGLVRKTTKRQAEQMDK